MTQAEEQVILTLLDLWPEYLKFIASENRKIKRRNDKAFVEFKARSEAYTKQMEELNTEADRHHERRLRDFEQSQKAWDAQPWHKKLFGGERPWLYPLRAHKHSTIYWAFPILERKKQPSIEEFLTWQTKRKLKN